MVPEVTSSLRWAILASLLMVVLPALVSAQGGGNHADKIIAGVNPAVKDGKILPFEYDWIWGELVYDRVYGAKLEVTNKCPSEQKVKIWVGSSIEPFLEVKRFQSIPPDSTKEIKLTIKTPPQPDPPLVPGAAPIQAPMPPWKLRGNPIFPPGACPSGIWTPIEGKLYIQQRSAGKNCIGDPKVYVAGGHIHLGPKPKKPDPGSPCLTYWLAGRLPEKPAKDCTDEFRQLAYKYIQTVLAPFITMSPSDWSWLPTPDALMQMNQLELLTLKKRAQAQLVE